MGNWEDYHENAAACGSKGGYCSLRINNDYEKLVSLLCFLMNLQKLNDESTPNILLNEAV